MAKTPGTARADGIATAIEPSMVARLVQGVRYVLTGRVPADDWFGPGDPLPPVAQEQAHGRLFDFPVRQNVRQRPRDGESVTFDQMRALADGYDFMRLIIETRKDQVVNMTWAIRPRDPKMQPDARCEQITQFLAYPDREHNWQTWLRMLVEEMLVLDAASIFVRPTKGGGIYSLDIIDGSTIKRVIDPQGRTPVAPDAAYQQVLKGLPAVDYSRDELLYAPRNVRAHKIYGYSPVEQVIMTVNIALRRQVHQLQAYTEGNIPEAIIGVPDEWNPEQIKQFQEYWDSLMEGQTGARRHAKFVPGGLNYIPTKEAMLKDEYDEWLARIVCFAFSVSPHAFVKQMNRATAETQQNTSLQEGLAPLTCWVRDVLNTLIEKWFGCPDLHFAWAETRAVDPLVQAQINQIYVTSKVLTPDEVRESLGLDPLTPEQRAALAPPEPTPMQPGQPGQPGKSGQPVEPDDEENKAAAASVSKKKAY